MNKYLGFYQLKAINIPTVQWEQFTSETRLDERLLWTIRVAVEGSSDLNLPRLVGVNSSEAYQKGGELIGKYSGRGLVIYYPYFIAEKSGVLEINSSKTIIEAVNGDLWNLVTHGLRDVTIISSRSGENENVEYHGDSSFLTPLELDEIKRYSSVIKGKFRDVLSEGGSIFAEWSYAYNTDAGKQTIGERYLVFYELRAVR